MNPVQPTIGPDSHQAHGVGSEILNPPANERTVSLDRATSRRAAIWKTKTLRPGTARAPNQPLLTGLGPPQFRRSPSPHLVGCPRVGDSRSAQPGFAGGNADGPALPQVSPFLLRWFTWYVRRYMRRHFHALRVSRSVLPSGSPDVPVVVYSNHASWWDPLICLMLFDTCFPGRRVYAPMDAGALEKYRLFKKLGCFGVERGTLGGAREFLRRSEAVLATPGTLLALTPQGRFADVRERPVRFAPGLGHLAARAPAGLFVPLAVELVFWEERLPEILVRFGSPIQKRGMVDAGRGAAEWTALFEERLEETQSDLASESQRRDPALFEMPLRGGAGQGGVYDAWRRMKAAVRGETFRPEHGDK